MLNLKGERELAYVATITNMKRIEGYDKICTYYVNGWTCIAGINDFKIGDKCVFIEPDSLCPYTDIFNFLNEGIDEFTGNKRADRHKIKVQKFCKGKAISAGLIMTLNQCKLKEDIAIGEFLTEKLGITYWEKEDNQRKADYSKYTSMQARYKKFFKTKLGKWLMKREWGRKICFFFMGKKKDKKTDWPVGKFSGVSKTDQERCENMTWILRDKTPFIRTQKCDGSSGTFILERKKNNKFEFYVCSRNVRMAEPDQKCFYTNDISNNNYYWQVAIKYDIENKMKKWLKNNPTASFICWQGEICGPGIQNNPQNLKDLHLFCFHWTDSINARRDIRDAALDWKNFEMEVVPIDEETVILPDDFEEFKLSADGLYSPNCCEGDSNCKREGYVYYKTTDPNFSFKNVSREYLFQK